MIAKSLAKTLKKNALRKILRSETQKADTREHILDAKTFLEKNFSYNGKFYNFKKEMLTIAASNERDILNKALKKLNKGKVDIYFPVDKHFEKWDPNDQKIKVGYVNPFKEFDPVNVYDIDGNHYLLSSKAPPEEAVLMVNYCEHHGNHEITPQRREDDPGDGDGGGGGSGGGSSNGNGEDGGRIILKSVKQIPDYCQDPWGSGDPELYYSYKSANKGINHENIPLPDVWDCINNIFYSEHDYNWHDVNKKGDNWYYDDYGNYLVYFFYEYDGGPGKSTYKFSFTDKETGLSTTFEFTITSYDDPMGSANVHRKDPSRDKDDPYTTGMIDFVVKWWDK